MEEERKEKTNLMEFPYLPFLPPSGPEIQICHGRYIWSCSTTDPKIGFFFSFNTTYLHLHSQWYCSTGTTTTASPVCSPAAPAGRLRIALTYHRALINLQVQHALPKGQELNFLGLPVSASWEWAENKENSSGKIEAWISMPKHHILTRVQYCYCTVDCWCTTCTVLYSDICPRDFVTGPGGWCHSPS
jgi:hypothetical protein